MRKFIAVLTGSLIGFLVRRLKIGGGSAAPGFYALKIDPDLVEKLSKNIPKNVIITGTNGKTTTARMLAHFAKQAGLKVIRNKTGSNLERGIVSAMILGSDLSPDLGIWELDEAAFNTVAPKLKPDVIVFLNVSRDQLDRYGEVDKVVSNWYQTLKKTPEDTILIINGDDQSLNQLTSGFKGKSLKFFLPKDIKLNGLKNSQFKFNKQLVSLPLPGVYHVYDAVAAFSAAEELKIPFKTCLRSLKTFQPGFGRVEKLPFGYIFLIKNPAGATQVFETIAPQIKPSDRLLLALNDNLADGTDVSWIWDANFELLQNLSNLFGQAKSQDYTIIISGSRAYDLAVRLKYAGLDSRLIWVENNLKKALRTAKNGLKGRLFILPTYTAMLGIQSILAKSGIKKYYWEEDN